MSNSGPEEEYIPQANGVSLVLLAVERAVEISVLTGVFHAEICDIDPRYGNALVNEQNAVQPAIQNWYVSRLYSSRSIRTLRACHQHDLKLICWSKKQVLQLHHHQRHKLYRRRR